MAHITGKTVQIGLVYTPCPKKRGHIILGITLTKLDTVSSFLALIIQILQCTKTLETLAQHCNIVT